MSTVLPQRVAFQRAPFVPSGFVQAVCLGCQTAISVPADMNPPLCNACQRSQAMADIHKLLCEIRDLRAGNGMYGLLTPEERDEQLASLGLPAVDAEPKYPGFAKVDSETLINIIADPQCSAPYDDAKIMVSEALAELCNRIDGQTEREPTPSEREELERTSIVVAGEPEDPERWDSLS
jgi:hypothetical protein